jgi:hypothetical protein
MLSVENKSIMLGLIMLNEVILSAIMLNVVILGVIMLNVVMLSVVTPLGINLPCLVVHFSITPSCSSIFTFLAETEQSLCPINLTREEKP